MQGMRIQINDKGTPEPNEHSRNKNCTANMRCLLDTRWGVHKLVGNSHLVQRGVTRLRDGHAKPEPWWATVEMVATQTQPRQPHRLECLPTTLLFTNPGTRGCP